MEAIYATDSEGGLSKQGTIPWVCKKDMKFFYDQTKHNVVVMGKNTYLSLGQNRPLKNRLNVVLTNNPEFFREDTKKFDNVLFIKNPDILHAILNKEYPDLFFFPFLKEDFKIFIIGGKDLYETYVPQCSTIWVTRLKNKYNCDLFFEYEFKQDKYNAEIVDDDNEITIIKYERRI